MVEQDLLSRAKKTINERKFFWEMLLSKEEYVILKNGLKQHIDSITESNRKKFFLEYSPAVALFLAEWFKREYNGEKSNQKNGLEVIGLKDGDAQKIWVNSKLDNFFLAQASSTKSKKSNRWLYSIYVLGGLPCYYISCNTDTVLDGLLNDLYLSKSDSEEEIALQVDSNQAYVHALEPNGSWNQYAMYILEKDIIPIDENDKKEFSIFVEKITTGLDSSRDNFLKPQLWTYLDYDSRKVIFEYSLKIGPQKEKGYIPHNIVKRWGLNSWADFSLFLREQNTISRSIHFSISGDGSRYIPLNSFQEIKISTSLTFPIEIVVKNGKEEKVLNKVIKPELWYQLYKDDQPYRWGERKISDTPTALIYRNDLDLSVKPEGFELNSADSHWNWVDIYDTVELTELSSGHSHIFIDANQLRVELSPVRGISEDRVMSHYAEQEETLNIWDVNTGRNNGIRCVYYIKQEQKGKKVTKVTIDNYSIKFNQCGSGYKNLNNGTLPETGQTWLMITGGGRVWKKKVYCLRRQDSGRELITRNCFNHIISFNIECKKIKDIEDGRWKDNTEQKHNDDYIYFNIESDFGSLTIPVYRAWNCHEIFFNDEQLITLDSDKTVKVPLSHSSKFKVRTIDENGAKRIKAKDGVLLIDYTNMTDAILSEDGLKYYRYTRLNQISPIWESEYKFYYWSLNPEDTPILVQRDYEIEQYSKGIVFQSLKESYPPNYLAPTYGYNSLNVLLQQNYTVEILSRCVEIAIEHNIPFTQFYPLTRLRNDAYEDTEHKEGRSLTDFVLQYLTNHTSDRDYIAMHRLAEEYLFQWILLPRKTWKYTIKRHPGNEELINKLFRTTPVSIPDTAYLHHFIDNYYWGDILNLDNLRRRPVAWNRALQAMRGSQGDFCCVNVRKSSHDSFSYWRSMSEDCKYIEFLQDVFDCENLFKDIIDNINV